MTLSENLIEAIITDKDSAHPSFVEAIMEKIQNRLEDRKQELMGEMFGKIKNENIEYDFSEILNALTEARDPASSFVFQHHGTPEHDERLAALKAAVKAHNSFKSGDSNLSVEKMRVMKVGRLGKDNPAYSKYGRSHGGAVRKEDAAHFDIYVRRGS